jgi:hypothetical protein
MYHNLLEINKVTNFECEAHLGYYEKKKQRIRVYNTIIC